MRLRQLGTTQSVVWFAPPEVHQSILDVRQKKSGDSINSYDVVHWLLEQTCVQIEQLQPLYISQGNDFCRRAHVSQLSRTNNRSLGDPGDIITFLFSWMMSQNPRFYFHS